VADVKVAVVTGAGRANGIGRAIAERLLKDGYRVVVSDIGHPLEERPAYQVTQGDELDETVAELSSLGECVAVHCDVRSEAQVDAMVQKTIERFGRLDVMVNNAGLGLGLVSVTDMSVTEWQLNMDVMATGVFLCSRAAARVMVAANRGGRIITIASQSGKTGVPLLGAYCAAKFAAIGLTQVLAQELGPLGITANAVCPGTVQTPMVEFDGGLFDVYARRLGMDKEDYKRRMLRTIPLGRLATTDDVAATVCFLASDDASFINGAAINVTGGQEMH